MEEEFQDAVDADEKDRPPSPSVTWKAETTDNGIDQSPASSAVADVEMEISGNGRTESDVKTAEIDHLKEEINVLVCENDALVKDVAALRALKDDLGTKVGMLEEEVKGSEVRISALQAELDSIAEQKQILDEKVSGLAAQVVSLEHEKSGLIKSMDDTCAEKLALTSALSLSQSRIQEMEAKILELGRSDELDKSRIKALILETEVLSAENEKLQRETKDLRVQIDAQESNLSRAQEQNMEKEMQIKNVLHARVLADQQIREKDEEIKNIQSEISDLLQLNENLKLQLNQALEKISALEDHHPQLLSNQVNLETRVHELQDKLLHAQDAHKDVCSALEEEQKTMKTLLNKLDLSESKIRALEEASVASEAAHFRYEEASQKDQTHASFLEGRIATLLKERVDLEEAKRTLEAELDSLKSESSPNNEVIDLRDKVRQLEVALTRANGDVQHSDAKARQLLSDLEAFSEDSLGRKSVLSSLSVPVAAISTGTLVAVAAVAVFKHIRHKG